MFAAFLTTVLFSVSAVSGNRTARLLGGTEANFARLCFAALLLGSYAHGFGGGLRGVAFPTLFISGCIGFGIGDAALFQALPRIGSRLSVMLVLCVSSPIAALMEWLWLRTALSAVQIFLGLVILTGVAIALGPGEQPGVPADGRALGTLLGLVAALCQASGAVLSRRAFAVSQLAGESINGVTAAYQRILGGVVVTAGLFVLVKRFSRPEPARPAAEAVTDAGARAAAWRTAWPWVLVNGLAGPALGVSCYQWALKTTPTGIVLPIVAITPLVIIPFARYFEGERPTLRSLFGGLVAVAGAVALALVSQKAL